MAVAYGLHVANLVFHESFPDIWKLYQLIPVEAGPEFGNFLNHNRSTNDIDTGITQRPRIFAQNCYWLHLL